MAIGEFGRLPLCHEYYSRCTKYWCKLLQMPNTRYPKSCYNMLKSLDDVGRKTWASEVRHLLFKFGFGFVWIAQDIGNPDIFMSQLKLRIADCLKQDWHSSIDNSSRCDHYKHFKSLLNVEKYISLDMPFHLRKAMARCRLLKS